MIISLIQRHIPIFRQPYNIIVQHAHIQHSVIPIPRTVHTCLIARAFHGSAERCTDICPGFNIQPVGSSVSAQAFRIDKDRIIQPIILTQGNYHAGFLHCLHGIHGLSKEIHSHRNACAGGSFHILFEIRVFHQCARRRSAVTYTDNGKFHSCFLYPVPVNFLIPFGNIYPEFGICFAVLHFRNLGLIRIFPGFVRL